MDPARCGMSAPAAASRRRQGRLITISTSELQPPRHVHHKSASPNLGEANTQLLKLSITPPHSVHTTNVTTPPETPSYIHPASSSNRRLYAPARKQERQLLFRPHHHAFHPALQAPLHPPRV